jgi:hypothetical protein
VTNEIVIAVPGAVALALISLLAWYVKRKRSQ